jgi:hypothetical protein
MSLPDKTSNNVRPTKPTRMAHPMPLHGKIYDTTKPAKRKL